VSSGNGIGDIGELKLIFIDSNAVVFNFSNTYLVVEFVELLV
jgi:hypothetical protein